MSDIRHLRSNALRGLVDGVLSSTPAPLSAGIELDCLLRSNPRGVGLGTPSGVNHSGITRVPGGRPLPCPHRQEGVRRESQTCLLTIQARHREGRECLTEWKVAEEDSHLCGFSSSILLSTATATAPSIPPLFLLFRRPLPSPHSFPLGVSEGVRGDGSSALSASDEGEREKSKLVLDGALVLARVNDLRPSPPPHPPSLPTLTKIPRGLVSGLPERPGSEVADAVLLCLRLIRFTRLNAVWVSMG